MKALLFYCLVVFLALDQGYATHTSPKYDLGLYDGLFLTHDDIRDLRKDMEFMMAGTIEKSQTEWIMSSNQKDSEECEDDSSSEEDQRRLFTRRRGTCSACCATQWKATSLITVMYNGTEYNVARGKDQYQIVFQGVCPPKKKWCGNVKCEEDYSFFHPVLVQIPRERDFLNSTVRPTPSLRFVPVGVSRYCRCIKGPGL